MKKGLVSVSVDANGIATTASEERYTLEEVAALVEHLQTKVYSLTKAKVAAYLEDKLGIKHVSDTPTGEMLDMLLREVKRAMYGVAKRHVPGLNRRLLLEVRKRREQRKNGGQVTAKDLLQWR